MMTGGTQPPGGDYWGDVSRETIERLGVYAQILKRWTPKINLVSRSTVGNIWERHFLDSAQVFKLAPKGPHRWLDIGSGGGFPGLVVAVLAAEKRPDIRIALVEADKRKAAFLRSAAREMGVAVDVISDRVENLNPFGAGVMSARALAPLRELLAYAHRHLAQGGTAILHKGATYRREVEDALAHWRFDVEIYPSIADERGVVLKIGEIKRV